MEITAKLLKDKFPELIPQIIGDEGKSIRKVGSLTSAGPNDLAFVFKTDDVEDYLNSNCGILMAPVKSNLPAKIQKTILLSPNPELAMAFVIQEFFAPQKLSTCKSGIHPQSIISPKAKLGKNVSIGAYTIIEDHVEIDDGTQISAQCVIEENVKIGKNCQIYPLSFVGRNCELGDSCIVQSHVTIGSLGFGYAHDKLGNHYLKPHIGRVIIGNRVDIGAGTMIDRGTLDDSYIGDGTKIDNLCHFGHNANIGKNALITAGFISAGSATIGNNFICGGRTTIGGHLKIGDNVTFAAFSAITKDHSEPGAFGGYPLVPMQTYIRNLSTTTYLAEMRKNIGRLLKKVFPEENQ